MGKQPSRKRGPSHKPPRQARYAEGTEGAGTEHSSGFGPEDRLDRRVFDALYVTDHYQPEPAGQARIMRDREEPGYV